jgi:hypothetical protein
MAMRVCVLVSLFCLSSLAAEVNGDAALQSLEAALATGNLWGEALAKQEFAHVALTKAQAATAREILWRHHVALMTREREDEVKKGVLKLGQHEMPFFLTTFGEKPKDGWSMWISMHGGGNGTKAMNDQQWENQKRLYKLEEGIYVAPRAPTNTWNLWHEPPQGWGLTYCAGMLSVPVDADLLDAANWTVSNFLHSDPRWLGGAFGGWLEGNAVVTRDGKMLDVLRVDTAALPEKAALVTVSADGREMAFDP